MSETRDPLETQKKKNGRRSRMPNEQTARPPGSDEDLIADLRAELARKTRCIQRVMKILEVPAAEYVPAINDAWAELRKECL